MDKKSSHDSEVNIWASSCSVSAWGRSSHRLSLLQLLSPECKPFEVTGKNLI